jgi:pimeloyl-ACP methyl ester carboxylesterase
MRAALSIVFVLVVLGCTREEVTMRQPQATATWMDQPAVLAVAFHPRREVPAPAAGFERLDIPVAPGVTIGGRFYAAGTNAPTVLFFHGNGEIVADYHDLAPAYRAKKLNFMPVDYRGYGLSTGTPTITSMLADARTVHAFARTWLKDHGYSGRFIVMGRSLGSASALELASARGQEIDGLIIDSGFAHLGALLARLGAPVPAGADADDQAVGQIAKMRTYAGPTLIIHGARDFIIPIGDAEDLHKACPNPAKELVRIEGAGHNDILAVAFRQYFDAIGVLAQGIAPRLP